MSHRTKKAEEKRKHRGPTFVGFAPRVEETKKKRYARRNANTKSVSPFNLRVPGPKTFWKNFKKSIDISNMVCYNNIVIKRENS